jgi:HK97 family phage portal protein
VLHDQFNESMTAFEGREFLVRSLDLSGNGYARIERNTEGEVSALHPYNPGLVSVERLPSGRLRYKVSDSSGGTTVLLQDDMLHVRGPTRDGITGQSPLAIARENLGLMIAQTSTALRLSTSGLSASGFLETAQTLEEPDRARLQQIMSEYVGTPGAGKLMILEAGMKYNRLTWSPEDAELLASRKLSDESVARLFGIPPTSVTAASRARSAGCHVERALGPAKLRMRCLDLRSVCRRPPPSPSKCFGHLIRAVPGDRNLTLGYLCGT